MAYPSASTRAFDYQGYQNANPTRPLPGNSLNADLNDVARSTGEIIAFLQGFTRADGRLANGSVGRDQLNSTVDLGFNPPAAWAPNTRYTIYSTVFHEDAFYKANVEHVAGPTFEPSHWAVIADFGSAVDAAAASATAAAASALAAQNAEADAQTAQTAAETAAAGAQAAETNAEAAQAAAEAAQAGAETAQAAAEAAAGSASGGGAVLCANVHTGGAGINLYELTAVDLPPGTPSSLTHGDRFRFTPAGTAEGGAIQIRATDFSDGAKWLLATDGHTLAKYFDLQAEKPVTVEYRTGLSGFVSSGFIVADQVGTFVQQAFAHGTGKLQTAGTNNISLTQEDGKSILLWNPNTEAFRLINFSVTTESSLFSATNRVEGVANQALAADTFYAVYLYDPGGHDGQAELDFWRVYTGSGVAYPPNTNEIGIYVKSAAAGAGIDNTRTFLGLLYTKDSDVSTSLGGSIIRAPCQSHLKPWRFPFESDRTTLAAFTSTSYVAQSTPRCELVTTGITDTGYFELKMNVTASTAIAAYVKLVIDGVAFDGSPFSAESEEQVVTLHDPGAFAHASVAWGAAVPMGHFRIRPAVKVSSGSATINLNLTGYIAN